MIELKGVSRRFGSFLAVNDLNISVHPGEIFAFLGVNGAGKTTTLRMMAGILEPTEGEIRIAGFDIGQEAIQAKMATGYIPDRPYLYGKLSGREMLLFAADLYRVPRADAEKRIGELLENYGLSDWQNELIDSYSHGMKQRLAACVALVHKPKVLIIDEPMVGLDPHGARLFKKMIRSYADQGMTVFLSTHSLNVAEETADRFGIINKGSLIALGTLDDIRAAAGQQVEQDLEQLFIELTTRVTH